MSRCHWIRPGLTALLGGAALVHATAASAAGERRITLSDLERQVDLSNAVLSPDGSQVALLAWRADHVDNRRISRLLLIDVASGAQRDLAPTRSGVRSPQWSPAGDRLAWLDTAAGGDAQIQVLSLRESASAAVQVGPVDGGVLAYRWSPDGRSFAIRAVSPLPRREERDRHVASFEATDEDFLAQRPAAPSRLGVVGIGDGRARWLTSADADVREFLWLADGRSLVFVGRTGTRAGGYVHEPLRQVDVDSGVQRMLLPALEHSGPPLQALYSVSPDGKLLAYARVRGLESEFRSNGIHVLPIAAAGRDLPVSARVDRSFRGMAWLDGRTMVATAADGTRDALWLLSVEGDARRLDLGEVAQLWDLSGSRNGSWAFIGTQPQRPGELYFMASPASKPRRLTRFNDELAALRLGRVDSVHWRLDGFEQSGVLVYPPGFQPGRKYPLVLNIHGGPMSTSGEGFSAFDQLMAAQGWLVFGPNYRGSRSLGDAFQRAVINDAGDGPGRDVMAGVEAVKALGIVDEARMAVSGWSYGGYLTTWLAAHYPVWRAAVAAAAVTDWFDQYSLSDMNAFFGYGLNGSPWLDGNAEHYWRQSSIAHAHRIRTPMLILSTTGDVRVPVTQSYKLRRALKDNQVPVRLVLYPQPGHMPEDPANEQDWYRRWMEWIGTCFDDPACGL